MRTPIASAGSRSAPASPTSSCRRLKTCARQCVLRCAAAVGRNVLVGRTVLSARLHVMQGTMCENLARHALCRPNSSQFVVARAVRDNIIRSTTPWTAATAKGSLSLITSSLCPSTFVLLPCQLLQPNLEHHAPPPRSRFSWALMNHRGGVKSWLGVLSLTEALGNIRLALLLDRMAWLGRH